MRKSLIPAALLTAMLLGCEGDSSSGTRNSPFVGSHAGQQTVTVSSPSDSVTASEPVWVIVREDGGVLIADAAGVFGSTVISRDQVSLVVPARVLADDPQCSGDVALDILVNGDHMTGVWSSDGVECDNRPLTISGTLSAARNSQSADVSQVLERASTLVRGAIQHLKK